LAPKQIKKKLFSFLIFKMSDESVKPDPKTKEQSGHISLRVVSQDGGEVFFKIRRSTPLRKLITTYCQRKSVNPDSIRFLYDGQRLRPEQTPEV
jgi:Ubiquitin-2 like Rad60 SUMO-like